MRHAQELDEPDLANLDRQPAEILTIGLEQVECAEHSVGVVPKGAEQFEHREPAVVADDGLAVDQAGPHRQRRDCRHDLGKAPAEIMAVARDQAHAVRMLPVNLRSL
jgi:hypothetical protein